MNIGDKIKTERIKQGWTQEQLAKRLTVSRSAVSGWEIGRNYPDLEMIIVLSDLFDISLDNWLREDKKMVKAVTRKGKMSTIYRWMLIIIGILAICYVGFNLKLRYDENTYRTNLQIHDWQQDEDGPLGGSYRLKQRGTQYFTIIMSPGLIGFPLTEQQPSVIARRDHLVVDVYQPNQIEVVVARSNDPQVPHAGKLIVNGHGRVLDYSSTTKGAQAYLKRYYRQHHGAYQKLIKAAITKRQQIVTK